MMRQEVVSKVFRRLWKKGKTHSHFNSPLSFFYLLGSSIEGVFSSLHSAPPSSPPLITVGNKPNLLVWFVLLHGDGLVKKVLFLVSISEPQWLRLSDEPCRRARATPSGLLLIHMTLLTLLTKTQPSTGNLPHALYGKTHTGHNVLSASNGVFVSLLSVVQWYIPYQISLANWNIKLLLIYFPVICSDI